MKSSNIYLIIALLVLYNIIQAQQSSQENTLPSKESLSLAYTQQDIIHSEILDENRRFNIFIPNSFYEASEEHTYPVLILLEDEFCHMTTGVVKHLSSVERMPEIIVVSIIDMSFIPTVYTNGSNFWTAKQLSDRDPDPFSEHLKKELFPYLKENYRANDFRIVMGLSPTSIYALHTFVKEPELFDAHIAIAAGDILGMGYKKDERFIDLITNNVKSDPNRK